MFNTYRLEMGTARCGAARAADRSIEAKRRHLKGAREEEGTNDRDTERTKGGSWSKGVGGWGGGEGGGEGTFSRVTGHPRHAQIFWQIYAQ